jgi:hypothetical protein
MCIYYIHTWMHRLCYGQDNIYYEDGWVCVCVNKYLYIYIYMYVVCICTV